MQAEFAPENGRLSFSDPNLPGMAIRDCLAWVRYRSLGGRLVQLHLGECGSSSADAPLFDVHGTGRQKVIHCPPDEQGVGLIYRINSYDQRPYLLLQLSLSNLSAEPIYLDLFCLFQAATVIGGHVQVTNPRAEMRFFKVGWHGWDFSGLRTPRDRNSNTWMDFLTSTSYTNTATPKSHSKGEFWSEGWGIIAGDEVAVVAGFVSTAHQFGQVYACIRPGEEELMLTTQMDGIRLDPGETCESEWGYLQFIPLPSPEPAADYVDTVARHMKARVPKSTQPMWTHWYQYYHAISEQLFLQNLDVLRDRQSIIPIKVVELDDGYQSAWGDWTTTNPKFPHGLRWLAEQIKAKGFTPGLWLAPFVVQAKSTIAREHPDWLVKNEHGKPLKTGYVYNIFIYALDTSNQAVLDHLRTLIDTLTHQWGYAMLKLDFVNAAALPGRRHNPKLTRAESLRAGLEAIRQAAGEETFLLGSGCPFGPAIGLLDAMRIGPDTAPNWEPYFHWLPWAGPLIKREPSIPSLRNAIRHTLNLSTLHQRWWWNDPDCLLVRDTDTHLTESEVQSAVTLVGLSGGMLVSSDDLGKVNPDRLSWLSLLIPNLDLRGLPLEWLEHKMPDQYRFELGRDEHAFQLVALFNWEDHPADCILQIKKLGFTPGAKLHVFDFWNRRYWCVNDPVMRFPDVPPHGCKLLRISEVDTAPYLVGDTLHISQGAEIHSLYQENDRLIIETVPMGRRVEGELWLALPEPPHEAVCNDKMAKLEDKGEGIYSLHLEFIGSGDVQVR